MKKRDEKPDNKELNALRQWLRSQGMTSAQANAVVKSKRRGEIAGDLRGWLKDRPKKVVRNVEKSNE